MLCPVLLNGSTTTWQEEVRSAVAAQIGVKVAEAMAGYHSLLRASNDMKPGNLLLTVSVIH